MQSWRWVLAAMLAAGSARAQWEILPSGSTADLRGVQAIGNGVVWASGTEGTVLRTINDGKEWQRCATPPDAEHLDFRGVQAFDASTAIVMSSGKGALSRLYKTTDGCKTWKLIFANPDAEGFWDAIQFRFDPVSNPAPNYGAGVLIGDPVNGRFIVYDTYDKGDTWLPWASDAQLGASSTVKPAIARRGESLFAASNSAAVAPGVNGPFAFATGGKGGARLIMPEAHSPFDNGTTWKFDARALPFTASETAGAFAIAAKRYPNNPAFADLMVVGGDYSKPNEPGSAAFAPGVPRLFLGVRGIQSSRTPPHGYRSAVAYDVATKTWITVGPNGTDVSTDDGRNWRALRPNAALHEAADADQHWNALSLPFVVGPHGRIGKLRAGALHVPVR